MKRITTMILLLFFMLGLSISAGCDGAKIDWGDIKGIAWTAVKEFVGQQIIIAKTKYIDDENAVKAFAFNMLHGSRLYAEVQAKLMEYNITIDEKAIIDDIYEAIDKYWRDVLNEKGIDVEGGEVYSGVIYKVNPGDFPGIYDVVIE